ncbi:MAG: FAD-binding oxidoreductase [Alphaproteobacteria bacterium]|nr:FAD-binding oxidoreductase [Alphaproteobacteria bacterium]
MTMLAERLRALLGPSGVIADPAAMAPYLEEQRGLFHGRAALVALPASTAETAAVVALCAEHGVAIVPQGGNTGLVGGGVPFEHGGEIVLSMGRMNRVRAIDPANFTITVEAGCVLANVQAAAEEAGCLFPLSLAAEGSCQIGGNLSTNAGGVAVLRWGNARDLVLGLEVVLADGRVWNGLKGLRKDNTGYDLKHLFVGAEGTLGVITAAVLKLFPRPRDIETALVGVADLDHVLALFARARAASGDALGAFELIPRIGLELAVAHVPGCHDPFAGPHAHYVLIEATAPREALENLLSQAIEDGLAVDAVIADSLERRRALWRLREAVPEAQKREGASIKHDVSVPVSMVPDFLRRATQAIEAALPGVRVVAFGHVGDGNIHFNLTQPVGAEPKAFLARWEEMNRIVHDIVAGMGGSFSAEHGVGRLKKGELVHYGDPVGLDLMRRIKAALDPQGIMNPGKVL